MTTSNSPTAIITKLAIIITTGNLFTHVWGQEVSGVCYGELGCFNRTHDYQHAIVRPVALLPQSPQQINTKLSLYTRQRPEGRHLLLDQWLAGGKDLKAFVDLSTDDRKPMKFIVIGFNDNPINQQWINRLKNELIINSDCNVFIVDWSKGNGLPYHQAIENMRVVAAQLYVFIINLWGYLHVDFNDYHLIGYSVGAHLAGLVGKQVKSYNASSALGRITGLEPARPYFEHIPDSSRLTKSDALFVDVIHTETVRRGAFQWGTGMAKSIGHIDFYPNGGLDQPGCSTRHRVKKFFEAGWNEGLREMFACNHRRAHDYFIESINCNEQANKCQFTAHACSNWQTFANTNSCTECGPDGHLCAQMGFNANKWQPYANRSNETAFYLKTLDRSPFCGFQYKVAIKMVDESNITDHNHEKYVGKMSLKFPNKSHFVDTTKDSIGLSIGQTYYSVVILADDLNLASNNDSYVEFKWRMSKMQRIFRAFRRSRSKILFISEVSVAPLSTGNQTVVRYCNANPMAGVDTDSVIRFTKC